MKKPLLFRGNKNEAGASLKFAIVIIDLSVSEVKRKG